MRSEYNLITYTSYVQAVKSFLQDVTKQNNIQTKAMQEQQINDIVSMNVIFVLLRYMSIVYIL